MVQVSQQEKDGTVDVASFPSVWLTPSVYIDPPYNTRSAFEQYDDNLEHTQWLAMIWPRLELLRDLLAEDGSIWVSIDDHEGHYLNRHSPSGLPLDFKIA